MSARERLILDLSVFAIVITAANPVVTGITLHEWLGMVLIVPALTHLILNWDWVVRAIAGFFGRIRNVARVNLLVDVGLFVSLVGVTLSGFLIIPGLAASFGLQPSTMWHVVHLVTSNLTVGFTLAHFALHWKWIANVTRRWVTAPTHARTQAPSPARTTGAPASARAAVASTTFDRR